MATINILGMGLVVILNLKNGLDMNWDLLNYHYYAGYSFLNDRLSFDIAPANIQGYFNPILNIPTYILIKYMSPEMVRPLVALMHGLVYPCVFALTYILLNDIEVRWKKYFISASTALVAIFGPVFLNTSGTSFVDNFSAILIICALIAFFVRIQTISPPFNTWQPDRSSAILIASFLIGIAVGLKLTNMVFALGYWIAVIAWNEFNLLNVVRKTIFTVLGIGVGIAVSGGWWAWRLYKQFENPTFPYFNSIFKSPFFAFENSVDKSSIPTDLVDVLIRPFTWLMPGSQTDLGNQQIDSRFALTLIFILIFLGRFLYLRFCGNATEDGELNQNHQSVQSKKILFLAIFFTSSFYIWLLQFGIRRYAIPLEVLAPVLMAMILYYVLQYRWNTLLWVLIATSTIAYTQSKHQREVPVTSNNYFGTEALAAPYLNSHTTFFMLNSWIPASYIIPAFSPDNRFIHLGADIKLAPNTAYGKEVEKAIADAKGVIKLISNIPIVDREPLANFGLMPTGNCSAERTAIDIFYICDLERVKIPAVAAAYLPLNTTINFGYTKSGWIYQADPACWSWNESWGVWATPSSAPWCSLLIFGLENKPANDLSLRVNMNVFLPSALKISSKIISVELNGKIIGAWNFDNEVLETRVISLPKSILQAGVNTLRFEDKNTFSKADAGIDRTDNRKLSFGLHSLILINPSK